MVQSPCCFESWAVEETKSAPMLQCGIGGARNFARLRLAGRRRGDRLLPGARPDWQILALAQPRSASLRSQASASATIVSRSSRSGRHGRVARIAAIVGDQRGRIAGAARRQPALDRAGW